MSMVEKEQTHFIGSFDVETDELSVQNFTDSLNRAGEPLAKGIVPRVFPFKWFSELPIAAQLLKYCPGAVVQPAASIAYDRPLARGARYRMAVEVMRRTETAAITVISAVVNDAAGERVLTISTEVCAPRAAAPTRSARDRSPRQVADDLLNVDVPALTPGDIHRYIEAVRDPNELHTDPMLARSFGFGGCVVPGLLILGQCELEIAKWRPESSIRAMSVKFLRPVIAGEPINLQGRIAPGYDTPLADFVLRFVVRRASAEIACAIDAYMSQG
jgi:hypothetical protein